MYLFLYYLYKVHTLKVQPTQLDILVLVDCRATYQHVTVLEAALNFIGGTLGYRILSLLSEAWSRIGETDDPIILLLLFYFKAC